MVYLLLYHRIVSKILRKLYIKYYFHSQWKTHVSSKVLPTGTSDISHKFCVLGELYHSSESFFKEIPLKAESHLKYFIYPKYSPLICEVTFPTNFRNSLLCHPKFHLKKKKTKTKMFYTSRNVIWSYTLNEKALTQSMEINMYSLTKR